MRISFQIALRYLFGKKSTNAINLITGISVLGISIGTAALILILSVFNGFEQLTKKHLDAYNPDYKLIVKKGKFFTPEDEKLTQLSLIPGVISLSKVLEEVAHFEYNSRQQIGIVKGVDENYLKTTDLNEAIKKGEAIFADEGGLKYAVVGNGIYNTLNISISSKLESLKISVPNRRKRTALDRDFKTRGMLVSGVFLTRNERDNQYVLADYDLVSALLDVRNAVSAIEINVSENADIRSIQSSINELFPVDEFELMDRLAQDASILKVMNIEKWSSYLIFSFTLILIIFNIIGCLWMIVLEKRKDLAVLQSFGATKNMIKNIFLIEGGLISGLGFSIGFIFSIGFYILQKTVGIITVPDGFSITNYPMEMEAMDVLVILVTVMALGIGASIPAAMRAKRVSAYVRIE